MSDELFYTSAVTGLFPFSSGLCTVAHTAGMSNAVIRRLETLSGYGPRQQNVGTSDMCAASSVYAYRRLKVAGSILAVLSRITPTAPDQTRRQNVLAHHVVVSAAEQSPAGPAWLARQPGVLADSFAGPPRLLPEAKTMPPGSLPARTCSTWASVAGDAGWAGAWAGRWLRQRTRSIYLICPSAFPVLDMLAEATLLLPVRHRWEATFTTAFTTADPNADPLWRCVAAGSRAAERLLHSAKPESVLDLAGPQRPAPDGPDADAARNGHQLTAPDGGLGFERRLG